mgnify:CR=1 FL=1|jgi:thymidylate synthase
MPINLIYSVIKHKNKLAIGFDNELLVYLKKDMNYFRTTTTCSSNIRECNDTSDTKSTKNIVLMGRRTWDSIPVNRRPLKDRINIILTNDKSKHNLNENSQNNKEYYTDMSGFLNFYKITNPNVFVIGGGKIYNYFINNIEFPPDKVYITEINNYKLNIEPNVFVDCLNESYKLVSVSQKYYESFKDQQVDFRFLVYKYYPNFITEEHKYLDLCKNVIENGIERDDRTGVGTISSFGNQLHFDISESLPVLTTKRVAWKHCIEELLWFMRGDTDARILQKRGVKIWDGNTSRQFLDSRGLNNYEQGILGAGYGWQWRFFGAKYDTNLADTSKIDTSKIGGFDQLQYILDEIKYNPNSRRIMMCYWNPPDFEKTALLPCHYSTQFYVRTNKKEKYLDCHFVMRSNDLGCGTSFNLMSYAVLTYIIALKSDMKPGKLVYTCSDTHIYKNHVEQIKEQLSRECRPFPQLIINPEVKNKPIDKIVLEDFDLVGYFPHPGIKMPMAI